MKPIAQLDNQHLTDPQGRKIGYLRLSLTPACPMRCSYCRPNIIDDLPDQATLNVDQIETLVRHLVEHWGLHKVRLTGGEPTVRRDRLQIIERLSCIEGLTDLAMTTNGLTLARDAQALQDVGLKLINISLDSLRTDTFENMTGIKGLPRVIQGIHAAMESGLTPIKINTVVLAGDNADQLPELVQFAAERDLEIRFIELMPMGPLANQWVDRYVPESQMRATLSPVISHWQPLEQGHDSARRFRVSLRNGQHATIGFITPMSCNFCDACNRLRLTASGDIYPCLMDQPRGNIMSAFTEQFDAKHFDTLLQQSLKDKAEEHPINGFTTMTILGG
jgi:cyclic pyranopterin phosphate synthase